MPPKLPSWIISLSPSITEILYALGVSQLIVAVTEDCDFPEDAQEKMRLKISEDMDVGEIQALKPDLVLTDGHCPPELVKKIKAKDLALLHIDPRTLREVEDSFTQIGRAVGREEEARLLTQDFSGRLHSLQLKLPDRAYRPKVYCEDFLKPPTVAGRWFPDLFSQLGAHYFPILPRELSRPVRIEEVVKFDPEVILFSVPGFGMSLNPDEALKRIGWEKLNAVRKRRVYTIHDDLLSRAGPRLPEGAKLAQAVLGESFWGWPLFKSPMVKKVVG